MVPDDFQTFLLATAGASAALVGLLFVAISVAPQPVVGASASVLQQVRASSALTALVTPLVMALIALIPGAGLGWPALVVGVTGTLFVAAAVRRLLGVHDARRTQLRSLSLLAGFLVVMVINLVAGVDLILDSHASGALDWVAGAMVASLGVGVGRAWDLVGARQSGLAASLTDLLRGGPADS